MADEILHTGFNKYPKQDENWVALQQCIANTRPLSEEYCARTRSQQQEFQQAVAARVRNGEALTDILNEMAARAQSNDKVVNIDNARRSKPVQQQQGEILSPGLQRL